jgi:SAM-dependent methyltransferase
MDKSTSPQTRADQDAVSAHYLGERGQNYTSTVQRHRALAGVLEHDLFAPHVRRTDTVLDFGCANGGLLLALDASQRVGIEVNPATRSEALKAGLTVFESLSSVADGSVDVAISNHVLEHVLSPYGTLLELRRVLRPDGRLVLCVPADDWRNDRRWWPEEENHHVFAWTPLTLGNLLTEAGFAPVFVKMRNRAYPPRYEQLHRLPRPIWEATCLLWATMRRRREILALAKVEGLAQPGESASRRRQRDEGGASDRTES